MQQLETFWHTRPRDNEHDDYYRSYIDRVPAGNVVDTLENQLADTLELLADVTEEQADQTYAPGKWSLKELLGHVIDTERIFACRALAFARGESQSLPGYDQDAYVAKYGKEPGTFFDQGYAAMQAILNAIEVSGGTDSAGLEKALRSSYVDTAVGKIKFDAKGDAEGVGFSVFQVQGGKFVELK